MRLRRPPSNNSTLHAYSKGVIRAHGTHCRRFLRACLGAFCRALLGGHCCKQEGQKEKRGPKRGRNCYVTPAFSGVPNAKRGEQNQKWSPTKGNKIRSGSLTPAFSRAQKRAVMLRHPCILGDPQRQARGAKSKVVPNKGEQNQKWLIHSCLLGGPKEGKNVPNPNSRGHTAKRGLTVPSPNSRGHATKRGLGVPNPNPRGHATKRGLGVPNPNSRGHATKRGLGVPNPNSRGHATKRGLRVPNPNSRGHATKRGLRVPNPDPRAILPAFSCYIAFCLGVLSTVASNFHKTDCGCSVRFHRLLCTIAILRMPPQSRSHQVGPWHGCMLGPIVHQAVRRAFCAMTRSPSHALNVEFISMPCILPFCVLGRYVLHCATGECNLPPHWHALYWHLRWVTGLWLASCLL